MNLKNKPDKNVNCLVTNKTPLVCTCIQSKDGCFCQSGAELSKQTKRLHLVCLSSGQMVQQQTK